VITLYILSTKHDATSVADPYPSSARHSIQSVLLPNDAGIGDISGFHADAEAATLVVKLIIVVLYPLVNAAVAIVGSLVDEL